MNRIDFIKNILGLFGASVLPIGTFQKYEKIYLLQCFIRGFQYYEGEKKLSSMKVGSTLTLKREPNNQYDSCAIELYFEEHKIGYLPAEENEILSKIIDASLLELIAEITHIEPNAATWENVHLAVYVLKEKTTLNNDPFSHLTKIETPVFNTLIFKSKEQYYRTHNTPNYVLNADEFYEAMVENSENDEVYSILHDAFFSGEILEKAIEEQRMVIQTNKLNLDLKADKVIKAMDDSMILLDETFGEKGYVVANINRVAELSPKVEKIEAIIDQLGQTFYEIVFKN